MAAAQQAQISQALQNASELHSFTISNVRSTGRQLGGGAYGTVEELEIDGLVCAGKKIHDVLISLENQGTQHIVMKYYNECSLLCNLRHPHIVQFLGICFLPDFWLPVLVMERLEGSLDELLENAVDIPLSTKVSILQDVAKGLVYLHYRSPSVIHRDLSARNVLLNSAMTAKIADLGNSRIVDIAPGQLAQTMTWGIPGTLVYMPPEALSSNPRYGPPLDMFSFGHLTLFTAIQVFPKDLLTPTYHDPLTDQVKGRNELERREKYTNLLHEKFEKEHPLVVLIKGCLEYEPAKRPNAREVLESLKEMAATNSGPYSNVSRLQLEESLTEKELQIPVLRSDLKQLNEALEEKAKEIEHLQAHIRHLEEEKAKGPNIIEMLKSQKKELKSRLEEEREKVTRLQQESHSGSSQNWRSWGSKYPTQIGEKDSLLAAKDEQMDKLSHALNAQSRARQGDLKNRKSPEAQMKAAKTFLLCEYYRTCAEKLEGRKKEGGSQYLCKLFQRVYDCTYENVLKEIGAKMFQPPKQELPDEQRSMFSQGYSLLISACELTDSIPDNVRVAVETTVKEDMQIEADEILCEFIDRALPIAWGMVTTSRPVILSSKAGKYDPDGHEQVAESHKQTHAVREWVCIQPALYRCLKPYPEVKARVSPKVETEESETGYKETQL